MTKEIYYGEGDEFETSGFDWTNLMWIIVFLILIGFFIYLSYMFYMDLPGNPQELSVSLNPQTSNSPISLSTVQQFYLNMKFNHNNITYSFDESCDRNKIEKMNGAFSEIADKVGVINFLEVKETPDIEISCSQSKEHKANSDYFIAGEGGAKEIIQTGRYNVINSGMILLYKSSLDKVSCKEPQVEIHELMHVLGFNHSESKESIMYPILESCSQQIDESMINELRALYSEENLPDLYFENISVIKKGRYLDFNFTVKNSGDVDAEDVTYSVFDGNELVETHDLGNIKYGAGISVEIENLKILHRDTSEIMFVIDRENKIKEIDKTNNIADMKPN